MPAVQLTTQVKSSTLCGRTSKFFQLDGLLLFCIIMGLRSASSANIFKLNGTPWLLGNKMISSRSYNNWHDLSLVEKFPHSKRVACVT